PSPEPRAAWRERRRMSCGQWGRAGCCNDSLEEGRGREYDKRGTRNAEGGTGRPTLVHLFRVPRSHFRVSQVPPSASRVLVIIFTISYRYFHGHGLYPSSRRAQRSPPQGNRSEERRVVKD